MFTDLSVAEKVSSAKLRMLVQLLSGKVFSHFDNFGLRAVCPAVHMQKSPGKKSHLGKNFAARLGRDSELGAVAR